MQNITECDREEVVKKTSSMCGVLDSMIEFMVTTRVRSNKDPPTPMQAARENPFLAPTPMQAGGSRRPSLPLLQQSVSISVPEPFHQQLIMNTHFHETCIEALHTMLAGAVVPWYDIQEKGDDAARFFPLMTKIHEFLQAFMWLNPDCQEALFAHSRFITAMLPIGCQRQENGSSDDRPEGVTLIGSSDDGLLPGDSGTGDTPHSLNHMPGLEKLENRRNGIGSHQSLFRMFEDNVNLCNQVHEETIQAVVENIERYGVSLDHLWLLQALVRPIKRDKPLPRCQALVMKALISPKISWCREHLSLDIQETRAKWLIKDPNCIGEELKTHICVFHVLTVCTEGRNAQAEARCQALLSLEDISHHLETLSDHYGVKGPLTDLLFHVYLDTQDEMEDTNNVLWRLFKQWKVDVQRVLEDKLIDTKEAVYVFGSVIPTLQRYFRQHFSTKGADLSAVHETLALIVTLHDTTVAGASEEVEAGHRSAIARLLHGISYTCGKRAEQIGDVVKILQKHGMWPVRVNDDELYSEYTRWPNPKSLSSLTLTLTLIEYTRWPNPNPNPDPNPNPN